MDWQEQIEQDVKEHLANIQAPLEDWDIIVEKARRICENRYAYHAWLVKTYANAHPTFVKSAGIKMHWDKSEKMK